MTMPDTQQAQIDSTLLMSLHREILYQYLAGRTKCADILARLNLPQTPENLKELSKHLGTAEFQRQVEMGRRDVVASVLDRFRERLHRWAEIMETLAEEGKAERTRFLAVKDILDRSGTGAIQKLSVTTPAQYTKILSAFMSDIPSPDSPKEKGDKETTHGE